MAPVKEELAKLKNSELIEELNSRGLDTSGKKSELVDRLWEAVRPEGQGKSSPEISEVKGEVGMGLSQDQLTSHDTSVVRSEATQMLAKLKALKEMQELEEQELRIKMRRQQMEIELKLADLPEPAVSREVLDSLKIQTNDNRVSTAKADATDLLNTQLQRILLPPTEVEKFDGNLVKYKLFIRSFRSRIESRTSDQDELLHYLEQLTVGKPKQIVRSCMFLGDQGYTEARRLLDQRYGSPHKVVDAYIQRLNDWCKIPPGDVEELDRLTLYLVEIKHAMTDLDIAGELEHPRTLREVVEKLPGYLRDRWMRKSDEIMEESKRVVRFKDLVDFLAKEVRVRKNPIFGKFTERGQSPQRPRPHSSGRVQGSGRVQAQCSATAVTSRGGDRCLFCQGKHFLDDCPDMKWRPMEERKQFIQSRRLCFACLCEGHVARFCRKRRKCGICGNLHATLLHRQSDPPKRDQTEPRPVNSSPMQVSSGGVTADADQSSRTLIPAIPVRVVSSSGKEVHTYAFCDTGSSGTFMSESLAEQLGKPSKSTTISVDTVCGAGTEVSTSVMENLKVGPLDGECLFSLPSVFTIGHIPLSKEDVCDRAELDRWPHLQGVKLCKTESDVELREVGLLIGANCPQLLMPEEVRRPESDGPCAVRTCLGWYVIGPSHRSFRGPSGRHSVSRIGVSRSDAAGKVPEADLFAQLYNQDFKDVSEETEGLSVEDKEWLTMTRSNMTKDKDGHFVIGLPFREFDRLPDSYSVARRRLESLRRRLAADNVMYDEYVSAVQRLFDEGYAEVVHDGIVTPNRTWYLPHHGVRHPEKGNLRLVFDCAAKADGVCLNDLLIRGPNLTNSLVGVLLRFRRGPVAFMCDVESMFLRVRLPAADAEILRFLWFRDNDVSGEVVVCRMTSHIFGAVSSPSVASFALRQCAEEGRARYPEAARVVEENVYVDDALVSVSSVDEAVHLASDLKQLCRIGAFNMRKFASNSVAFLQSVPCEDRCKNAKALDLDVDSLRPERALGMLWSVEEDMFRFHFVDRRRPVTRRGILSTVSGLFDPLGIVSPVTLQGKVLVQKLCSMSCGWDDSIPTPLEDEWSAWLEQARRLDVVGLERCLGSADGEVGRQLHIFSDASEIGHSAVAFLRVEDRSADGAVVRSVRFVMGKALVNPVRFVTIPRLELAAAVVAVKLKVLIEKELGLAIERTFLWTDSTVVLQYIRNRTSRYKTYVANRVGFIHDKSSVDAWSYVPSAANPADVGSRGAGPEGLTMWLEGPDFLSQSEESWPSEPVSSAESSEEDPEVKRSQSVAVVAAATDVVSGEPAADLADRDVMSATDRLVSYFSSWYRLKKAVAWYRKLFVVLKLKLLSRARLVRDKGLRNRGSEVETSLSVADLSAAEDAVFRYVQKTSFPELSAGQEEEVKVAKSSPLSRLNLARKHGILVVRGRLSRCPVEGGVRCPVLLPRNHHVTQLVVRDAHTTVGHQGREHTLSKLRERFWILGVGALVRSLVRSCVVCRRVSGVPQVQMMSDLPEDRVTPETPAFAFVGLDVFGPVLVKRGRSECKRYGLMCTCLVTRAVHVEVLHSLQTDSLINAIRRIVARRGPICRIRSDLGTNMVGANNELMAELAGLDGSRLQQFALSKGIEWVFNPAAASHFGGCWERCIRTFRKVWKAMPTQTLNDEGLHTLFCEVESVMNSRPLTHVSCSNGDLEPLTPNHLLLLRGCGEGIPGRFSEDSLSVRQWRRVQYLADQFWLRWKREYLPTLQQRQRWVSRSRNIAPGDVVLVVSEDVPRGQWRLGKVTETFPSRDGLVRKVSLRTGGTALTRPVHKLILLLPGTDLDLS